jgi:hypothetical protein
MMGTGAREDRLLRRDIGDGEQSLRVIGSLWGVERRGRGRLCLDIGLRCLEEGRRCRRLEWRLRGEAARWLVRAREEMGRD